MQHFPPTFIWRHRKENLKKCSLRGLEEDPNFCFFSYPQEELPNLEGYVLLSMEGPELSSKDAHHGLLLLDATWCYAACMERRFLNSPVVRRTVPNHFRTAYPRRQTECPDPRRGLASVEALYVAYFLLGRDCQHILDRYFWKEAFLEINNFRP